MGTPRLCLNDPHPRSRRVFAFHRPETLLEWTHHDKTLRARLREMPAPVLGDLRECGITAIKNLEKSFAEDKPRALIQMATGSGKTRTSVAFTYRLIKHAHAKRVVFLVDRNNLGRQTKNEFQQYITPDDGRKFTERNNVQPSLHLHRLHLFWLRHLPGHPCSLRGRCR